MLQCAARRAGVADSLLCVGVLLLGLPGVARSTPVTYFNTGGTVTISITTGAETLLVVPGVPLTGVSMTFDDTTPELIDVLLTIANVGPAILSRHYEGYDVVVIHNANLAIAGGYDGTGVTVLNAAVANYAYTVGPLTVSANWSAVNSLGAPPAPRTSINIFSTMASGGITLNAVTANFTATGITIFTFDPLNRTEAFPLVVKGDFVFRGVVPEPGTAILFGASLLGLMAAGRHVSARR